MMVRPSESAVKAFARVMRWVQFYTRGLPDDVAEGRRDELLADLHDQAIAATESGTPAGRLARDVMVRALKGAAADLAWRRDQKRMSVQARPIRSGSLIVGTWIGGATLAAYGLLIVLRRLQAASSGGAELTATPGLLTVLVGTAAAVCAVTMIARARARLVGALWLVGASQLLVVPGLDLLAPTSTVLTWASATQPVLQSSAFAASIGIGIVFLAVAVAWMPARRRDAVTA